MIRRALGAAALTLLAAGPLQAQMAELLPLEGRIADGTLELEWPPLRGSSALVLRRPLGETGRASWQRITPRTLGPFQMVDDGLQPGTAYEYQIILARPGRQGAVERPRVGTWVAGTEVPAQPAPGVALVIVDETLAPALSASLAQFEDDLTGAGWQVERLLAPRGEDSDAAENLRRAAALRAQIADRYRADPQRLHALILVGHLPLVKTGRVVPDGHGPHAVPSDLYYADADGLWPATRSPDKDVPQLLPSRLPGLVEMQVGRIDFAHLDKDFGDETALIAAYLDRNHRWRQGETGDPRIGYAASNHLKPERAALVNILGEDAVRAAGHHDHAGGGPYLLGVDFGSWQGKDYRLKPSSEAVFTINFGSGKHRFDGDNNAMTALMSRGEVLAVGWGGRPSWQLNGMALGDSIGTVHRRTVNNGLPEADMRARDYPVTGNYDWVAAPWVNLLGDPTLTPFPLAPVRDARAEAGPVGVTLSWTLPPGASGAQVFHAARREGPYVALSEDRQDSAFTDQRPDPGGWYLIRAEGLAEVHAGSFWRLAQGVFLEAPAR